jgi:hypothetical protein
VTANEGVAVFKLGAIAGLAVGYYLGTKAGPERAAQIERLIRRARRSDFGEIAADKARAVVDLSVERARQAVSAN